MLNPFTKSKLRIKISPSWEKNKPFKPDIVRVFESCSPDHPKMRPSGRAIVTLCPFHSDTKPSFALYPDTNTYYCFSCGAYGDGLNLAMKLLGYDFKSAIEYCRNNDLYSYI